LPTKRVTGAQIVCGTTQLGFELKAAKKNQKIFLTLPTLEKRLFRFALFAFFA